MASRKGFVYDTESRVDPGNTSPELSDYSNVVDEGILVNGVFDSNVSNLTPNTTYYYRAFGYDDSSDTYIYGDELNFTTLEATIIYDTNMIVSDGQGGTALKFDGVDDIIELGNLNVDATDFSLVFEAKPTKTGEQYVFRSNIAGSTRTTFGIRDAGYWSVFDDGSSWEVTSATAIINEWQSVAYTYNRSSDEVKLYLDNTLIKTFTKELLLDGLFEISSASSGFDGAIKNLRVFPRVLSAEEIGQITSNPTVPLPLFRSGKQFDKALYFNGIDRYVDVSNIQDLHLGNFTVSMWVNSQLLRNGQRIIYERNSFMLWLDANNELRFQYNIAGNNNNAVRAGNLPQNDFILIIVEFDGSSGKIYLNNVDSTLSSTSYGDLGVGTDNLLTIGRRTDNADFSFFEGLIQDVRIYDQTLSTEEKTAIYNEGLGSINSSVPIAYDDEAIPEDKIINYLE